MKREITVEDELDSLGREWDREPFLPDDTLGTISRIEDLPNLEDIDNSEVQWDIEGIVPSGTLSLWTGESGHGKSTVLCAAGEKVSKGEDFLGRATTKRPVLVLDAENPSTSVSERFARLGIRTNENFRVWGQWVGQDPPAVGHPLVMQWVERCDPKPLVIVDSLIAFHPGAENDSTETRKYLAQYRKLTAMGATVILLHHIGKSDTSRDYRGSSDIKASVDVGYKLTSLGDGSRLSVLELRAFKQRISVTPVLGIRYVDGQFQAEEHELPKTVTQQLAELLQQNPGILKADFEKLAGERGLGRNRGRDFIDDGVKHSTIRTEQGTKNSRLHYWRNGSVISNPNQISKNG